jgi:hypothetical protein
MKKTAILLILAICLAAFAGCSDYDDYASMDMGFANGGEGNDAAPGAGGWVNNHAPENAAPDNWHGSDVVAGANVPESAVQRRVIRTAHLRVETTEISAADLYAQIVGHANFLGGHEFSSDMRRDRLPHRTLSRVNAVLRIPPEQLDEFLRFVGEVSQVLSSAIDSDDVTAEFYDLTTRLTTKRGTLAAYFTLLENAETLDDILRVQRMIDQITEEIEATEGRLNVLNNRVNMATVQLEISHVTEYEEPEEPRREVDWGALTWGDMGWLIRNGFISVMNIIATMFQWLLIITAVTAPIWIPVVAALLVTRSKRRKRRAERIAVFNDLGENDNNEDNDKSDENSSRGSK